MGQPVNVMREIENLYLQSYFGSRNHNGTASSAFYCAITSHIHYDDNKFTTSSCDAPLETALGGCVVCSYGILTSHVNPGVNADR